MPKPLIRATEIGEYIRHRSCERRFKLDINNRVLAKQLPFAERLFNTLDPVLQEAGREREDAWEESLRDGGIADLTRYGDKPANAKHTAWADFRRLLEGVTAGQASYGREVQIAAEVDAIRVEGRVDFILLLWEGGRPVLRLVECKASRRDRTYHRVQVALYRLIVQALLRGEPLSVGGVQLRPDDVQCVVARIDEATNECQQILAIVPPPLEMQEADLRRLAAETGPLVRIANTNLDDLEYSLDEKCDGCVFSVNCFPEAARRRGLELLSITPSAARALRANGIGTIDALADLDIASPAAAAVRTEPGFSENLAQLKVRAQARRKTLVGGGEHPEEYEVSELPYSGDAQLPPHESGGRRLVRVYLTVDYDYAENRVGALSAHVTSSDGQLHTEFAEAGGRWTPQAGIRERVPGAPDGQGRPTYTIRDARGQDIVEFISSEWTGRYETDTGVEQQLIQGFFRKLVEKIAEVANGPEASVHFYVWSRSEMARLVEACSRVNSSLLSHLRELLGCRESLEQLIYSTVGEEVDRRYGLGWTSRGLSVVSSLKWYGRRFHWRRRVNHQEIDLDRTFNQDLFDFKTTLDLKADGAWAKNDREKASTHRFEIRSRFFDTLTAPYWRANWHTLPDPEDERWPQNVRNAIRRYNEASGPGVLNAYLASRTHALRWVEENVRSKNADIVKPPLRVADLPNFSLNVDNAAQAGIDFLRLDQHMKMTDWISGHLQPPASRVPTGRTLPVAEVVSQGNGAVTATISVDNYDIDLQSLSLRCGIAEGAFVRLTPYSGDPHRGQTFRQLTAGGRTCRVTRVDWTTGQVTLEALFMRQSRYALFSGGARDAEPLFDHATIDESPSDFVAGRVDNRLASGLGAHMFSWFDPEDPEIPEAPALAADARAGYGRVLEALPLPPRDERLADDQRTAILDGLQARVQILQGPPGTGKTTTTAVTTLLRILARRRQGDIILLAANTHTAIDNLLQRIAALEASFRETAAAEGLVLPAITLSKVHSSMVEDPLGGGIRDFTSGSCARFVAQCRRSSVLLIGGTTGAMLKMAAELGERRPFKDAPGKFQAQMLILDEASMMVFPHFLSLATLIEATGDIMVAGDHRQLAPIVAHDWEREDRPPAVVYQPFASAYQAIHGIAERAEVTARMVLRSALSFTFRLPPLVRDLIGRLYRLDNIQLEGLARPQEAPEAAEGGFEKVWEGGTGMFLVLHDERRSSQSNAIEAQIIEAMLRAVGAPEEEGSVAIVTPHRAQRSLLRTLLREFTGTVDAIDTVERLQGGERDAIIVSATASDPSAIAVNVEFILDLNRSNVAFSRAKDRLIVVCSEALLDHIPADLEDYESAMLWKSLRALCSVQVGEVEIEGHRVRVLTPLIERAGAAAAPEPVAA